MKIVPGAIAFSVHRKFDSDRVSLSREETNLTRSIWMAPTITQPAVRDADLRKAVRTALPDTSRPRLLQPYRPFPPIDLDGAHSHLDPAVRAS